MVAREMVPLGPGRAVTGDGPVLHRASALDDEVFSVRVVGEDDAAFVAVYKAARRGAAQAPTWQRLLGRERQKM